MIISNLIHKGGLAQLATATPATLATLATLATQEIVPEATVAQVATVAVAKPKPPATTMTGAEELAILAWLAHIEETDDVIIAEVLDQCRTDADSRAYFLRRAAEVPQPVVDDDDRRHCEQCVNLVSSGLCLAARRGEIIASRTYHPLDDLPRRCEGYAPGPNDPDRRPGRERWPRLRKRTR